ncbi:MAG: hypothetical protein KME64_39115 [Scytonematopsis contorta HA4267-MV1]|jgi:signal transduction histidine kinase|nr:hypothetical protein [Scytonematopsis contorta HA4267-MV1]
MLYNNQVQIHSKGVFNLLRWMLLILLGLLAILANLLLLQALFNSSIQLAPFYSAVASLVMLGNLTTLVIALIWLFQVHKDLQIIYPNYQITPGGALARFMIPFYNLVGIWETLATIGNHYQSELKTRASGNAIQASVIWLYVTSVLSYALNSFVSLNDFKLEDGSTPVYLLITTLADFYLIFVRFNIAQAVNNGIRIKSSKT